MAMGSVYRLAVALSVGMLLGLERGWRSRDRVEGQTVAGFRTFSLIGLMGGVCALVPGPWLTASGMIVVGLSIAGSHYLEAKADSDLGLTTLMAGLLTYALGALAVLGEPLVAAAAATAAVSLLASKSTLHRWIRAVSWPELRAFFVLVFMSALILPLMPTVAIDPWGAMIPAEIWLLAILVAALSLVGHGAVRALGPEQGLGVSALAGGLVSSTAVGLLFARSAKQNPDQSDSLAGAALLASAVMAARTLGLIGIIQPSLLGYLAPSLACLGCTLLVGGVILLRRIRPGAAGPVPDVVGAAPFDLFLTLRLAAVISVVMLAARLASKAYGQGGVLWVSALGGIADVDAVTLSLARAHTLNPQANLTALAIGIAIVSNTIAKSTLAIGLGGWRHGRAYSLVSLMALFLSGLLLMFSLGVWMPK